MARIVCWLFGHRWVEQERLVPGRRYRVRGPTKSWAVAGDTFTTGFYLCGRCGGA